MTWFAGLEKRDIRLLVLLGTVYVVSWSLLIAGEWLPLRHLLRVHALDMSLKWAESIKRNIPDLHELIRTREISAESRALFALSADAGRIFRYRVFNKDGLIVFSSDPSEISRWPDDTDVYEVLRSGAPSNHMHEKPGHRPAAYSETYVPIYGEGGVEGALEVYIDLDPAVAQFRRTAGQITLSIALGMLMSATAGAYFLITNIRRRNRSVAALAEREARWRAILESTPDCVKLLSAEGAVLEMNPAGARILGAASPDEVVGKDIRKMIVPEHRARVEGMIAKTFLGESRVLEYDIVTLAGQRRSMEAHAVPLRDSGGGVVACLCTSRDVTERKRAQEELTQAKDAAELASRAKTNFLANMSHELRTPLNAIIGFSQLMKDEAFGPLSGRYREYAADIHESGGYLLSIINDILDLAKIESGRHELDEEVCDAAEIVDAALRTLQARAEEAGVELSPHVPEWLPALRADRRVLKQVLLNLISNAVKFTPKGGRVTVAVRVDAEGRFVMTVADTGVGIAREEIARVLAPFEQVDPGLARRHQGTGLGLPLAKRFVELHGGTLTLESEPGVGTAVTVRLPGERTLFPGAADGRPGSGKPTPSPPQAPSTEGDLRHEEKPRPGQSRPSRAAGGSVPG